MLTCFTNLFYAKGFSPRVRFVPATPLDPCYRPRPRLSFDVGRMAVLYAFWDTREVPPILIRIYAVCLMLLSAFGKGFALNDTCDARGFKLDSQNINETLH